MATSEVLLDNYGTPTQPNEPPPLTIPSPDLLNENGILGEVLASLDLKWLKDSVSEEHLCLADLPLGLGDLERGEDDPSCLFGIRRERVSATTCKALVLGKELSCRDVNWEPLIKEWENLSICNRLLLQACIFLSVKDLCYI